MGNDNVFLRHQKERTKRRIEIENQRANNYLIVTEGIETEPNYFNELIQVLKEKYPSLNINFTIEGMGRNTTSLVKSANELQYVVDKYRTKIIPYAETFVVFDKDSFSDAEFNKAIKMCEQSGFIPLWSNEAIEYWFLLHFNKHEGIIYRKDYEKLLNKEFKANNSDYQYHKNNKDIYSKLNKYGSTLNACKYAKDIHEKFKCKGISPAKSQSSTTLYKFFEMINEKIKEI